MSKVKQKIKQEIKKLFDEKLTPVLEPKKRLLTDITQQRQRITREIESFQHKVNLTGEQIEKLQAEIDQAIVSGKTPDLQKIAVKKAEKDTFERQLIRLDAQGKEEEAKEAKADQEVKETIKTALADLHGDILNKVEAILHEAALTMCIFEDIGLAFCKEHGLDDKETVRSFSLFQDIDKEIEKSIDPFIQRREEIESVILRREVREKLLLN